VCRLWSKSGRCCPDQTEGASPTCIALFARAAEYIKHLAAYTQGYALQLVIIVCCGKVLRHVKVSQTADHAQVHGALHSKRALHSRNTTCGSRRNSGRESRQIEEGTPDDSCHNHMHSQVDELQDAAQLLSSRAHMS
jgi:hypothetical protein